MKLVAIYKVFNGKTFLEASIKSIYNHVDGIFVNISTIPWGEQDSSSLNQMDNTFIKLLELRKKGLRKIKISLGEYSDEYNHVMETLRKARQKGHFPDMTHALYIDADEGYTADGIKYLRKFIEAHENEADEFKAYKWCFWKNYNFRIIPPEYPSLVVFKVHDDIRYGGHPNCRTVMRESKEPLVPYVFKMNQMCWYHFSWIFNNEEEVKHKLAHSTHRDEFIPNWYPNVWKKWTPKMVHLHPVAPKMYGKAIKYSIADIPKPFLEIEKFCDEGWMV